MAYFIISEGTRLSAFLCVIWCLKGLCAASFMHSHTQMEGEHRKGRALVLTQAPARTSAKKGMVLSLSVNLSLIKSFTCGTQTQAITDKLINQYHCDM